MANNILLFNAAYNGYLAGSLAGGNLTDNVQADYLNIVSQASTFAVAMDAAIAPDVVATPQPATSTAISGPAGVALIPPGGGVLVEAQAAKPQLLEALSFGAAFQRYVTGAAGANFAVNIAAIKAIYFQGTLAVASPAIVRNNNLLFNAALNGYLGGVLAGGYLTDAVQADYAAIVVQAQAFATAVDTVIPSDLFATPQPPGTFNLSVPGGAADAMGGSQWVEAHAAKVRLLQDLCFGVSFQRYSTLPAAQAVFPTMAAAIKAVYFEGALFQSNTGIPGPVRNNVLLFNAALNGYLAGSLAGENLTDNIQANYANITLQAHSFATVMDTAVPNDAVGTPQPAGTYPISLAGGAAQVLLTTGAVEAWESKVELLEALCFANVFSRYSTDTSISAAFTSMAAAIKAVYFEGATLQVNSGP